MEKINTRKHLGGKSILIIGIVAYLLSKIPFGFLPLQIALELGGPLLVIVGIIYIVINLAKKKERLNPKEDLETQTPKTKGKADSKEVLRDIKIAILALVVLIISAFIVLMFFSETQSNFRCVGTLSYAYEYENKFTPETRPLTIYLKLTEYRPWVSLWSDSNASINIEVPNELYYDFYSHVEKVGDQLQLYKTYPVKELRGNFSTLSKTLAIQLDSKEFFDGNCSIIN